MSVKVGQELWWVPCQPHSEPSSVTATKVGHKWIELSNGHKVDKNTLANHGNRCYLSQSDHEAATQTAEAWDLFKWRLDDTRNVPAGVTAEDIDQATKLLRLR